VATDERSFGYLLRRSRLAALLTQDQLAERAHLSYRTISDLERGAKHAPRRDTVLLLVDALELSPQERTTLIAAAHPIDRQPEATELPAGQGSAPVSVRTFLIADLRGYTDFTEAQGDEAAARLTTHFAALVRECVGGHEGQLVETRGDEVLVAFSSARQALRAAVDLQVHFAREARSDLRLHVGIGLDAGEAIPVEGGYRGGALNLAARLCALAGPGEVLASEGVVHLARKVEGLEYVERGLVELKGFSSQVRIVEIHPSTEEEDGAGPPVAAQGTEAAAGVVREPPLPIGGFLGALPARTLVKREGELQKILSAVDAVAGGSGRLVLLAGEPGVGKTRLAQEVTLHVRNRRFLVAAGRCYEPRQVAAFYPFIEALGMLYAAAPAHLRNEVPRRWAYLGRLLPNEDIPVPASSSGSQDEHERLFWAATGFLQAIASETPVALLLDDVHWADTSSLELFQHLARQTRGNRVLLLGTYRDAEVGGKHPLEQALRDLTREQLLERVAVRRLDQEGTRALIGAAFDLAEVSDEFAALLQRQTEGNPFFVQEVLRALVERGDIYRENGRWERREIGEIEVPETIRSAVGERLSRLTEESQEILHEASVLGLTFGFDVLQELGDREEGATEAALEEAAAAGLVVEMGKDSYAFNHALTHQTLYGKLAAHRKRRLHLAAGEALERLPEQKRHPEGTRRATKLAWHFLEGDDSERALVYAMLAGDQAAAVFAHAEAERHYHTALELARELSDPSREATVLEKLGGVLRYTGQLDDALEFSEQAAQLYRAEDDLEDEARAVAQIGFVQTQRAATEEGIARLQPAIGRLEEASGAPSPALAELYYALAFLLWLAGRYDEQLAAVERAAELARVTRTDRVLSQAEFQRGLALLMLGRVEEALRVFNEALPLMEALGDLFNLSHTLNNLGYASLRAGELERSRRYIEQALEAAERLGDPVLIAFMTGNLGQHAWIAGEWRQARSYLERALELAHPAGTGWVSASVLAQLGEVSLAEGKVKEGTRLVQEGIAIAEQAGDLQTLRLAHRALAEQDLLEGRPAAALDRLEPLLDRPGLEEGDVTDLLPHLAQAQLALGRVDDGEETAAKAVRRSMSQKNRLSQVHALRAQSGVLAHLGRWDDGQVDLEEAIVIARRMPYPYAEARALYDMGMLRLRKRDAGVTQEELTRLIPEPLKEALTIFERLGARKDAERTRALLAGSGA